MTSAGELNPELSESQILAAYLPKLIRLAEMNMSERLRRKVDADDVGATVVRTVLRQVREGKLQLEQTDEFWKQLVAITLNKVRKKARYWTAQKRDMGRESHLSDTGPQLADLAVHYAETLSEPTEEQGKYCAELLSRLNDRLDEKHATVLTAKLNGKSNIQIAGELNVSTRTVGRYLNDIREELLRLDQED